MVTKKIKIEAAIIIVATLITGCKSCKNIICSDTINYSFNSSIQIYPAKDSIKIGDSIYILSTIPFLLTDQISGAKIDCSGAKNVSSTVGVVRLKNDDSIPIDAVTDFDYFSMIGRIYNDASIPSPNGVQQLSYKESNGANQYQLKVGLIAKKSGIYALGIGNGGYFGKNDNNCEKASFDISISNTLQHIEYYQKWQPTFVLDDYAKSKLYCFKVY